MKKAALIFISGLFLLVNFSLAQTNYSWASYPTRCTGVGVYTQPNMTVDVTGSGFANYGPQCAASACAATAGNRYYSPKYVTSPNPSAPDWQYNGLALGVNWSNTSSTATVVITFTTAVCGPLTFSIYDINSGTWGGYNPVWRDRVTISGTNNAAVPIYPSTITGCANNTIGGANNNIISAGLNTGCTNNIHTITFNSPTIKTITILYSSMAIDATYGTDPDPEYIIISDIVSTSCILPENTQKFSASCSGENTKLAWISALGNELASWEILKSENGLEFNTAVKGSAFKNHSEYYEWTDSNPDPETAFYRLREITQNGIIFESKTIHTDVACNEGLNVELWPNPASESFQFTTGIRTEKTWKVLLTDLAGRSIFEEHHVLDSGNKTDVKGLIQTQGLSPGVYLVTVYAEGMSLTRKILIKNN